MKRKLKKGICKSFFFQHRSTESCLPNYICQMEAKVSLTSLPQGSLLNSQIMVPLHHFYFAVMNDVILK
jgi:hypothetical protein